MRYLTVLLIALLALVQGELWLGHAGVPRVLELKGQLADQRTRNSDAAATNARLAAEVRDLQEGLEIIEEKARAELGMVKPDEILVQYTQRLGRPRPAAAQAPSTSASQAVSPP
ncbi:MAG: cell division protein FtsB [Burkholderiales bacterium]